MPSSNLLRTWDLLLGPSPTHICIPRSRPRAHDRDRGRARIGRGRYLRGKTGAAEDIGRYPRRRIGNGLPRGRWQEREFDDGGGKRLGIGSGAFKGAHGAAAISLDRVSVVTHFQRRIQDAVPAAPQPAIGTACGVGRDGILRARVAFLARLGHAVAAEGRLQSHVGRRCHARSVQAFFTLFTLAVATAEQARSVQTQPGIALVVTRTFQAPAGDAEVGAALAICDALRADAIETQSRGTDDVIGTKHRRGGRRIHAADAGRISDRVTKKVLGAAKDIAAVLAFVPQASRD